MYQAKSKIKIYVVTVWWTHRDIAHFQSCLFTNSNSHGSRTQPSVRGIPARKGGKMKEVVVMGGLQNSRPGRVGQSTQGWESKRQEHHQMWESFSMNRDDRHWSWGIYNDKTWLAGLINTLCGRRAIKWITFPPYLEPSHALPQWQQPALLLPLPKMSLGVILLSAAGNWSLTTCVMFLMDSGPMLSCFLLDSSSPQQLNMWQHCHLKQADYRTPQIAEHHQFSCWVTRSTKSDESFLREQEMIDLNNRPRIFTWHLNTVAVMITNVSLPHRKSIIGRSVLDNLYSHKIFTLSQFWIVANISWDSHFVIQGSFWHICWCRLSLISPFSCLFYSLSLVPTYSFFVLCKIFI